MVKVSRRGGFSDRQGIKSENTEIQLKDLDTRTRTQIYNLLSEQYKFIYQNIGYWNETIQSFFRYISSEVFCQKVDARNQIEDDAFFDKISQVIMNNSYDDVLTLVEAISEYWEEELNERYPYRGYGGMFRKWLASDNPQPYNSYGNGSAMRVSPVGWAFDTLEEILEKSP